ncbi:Transglutaminase-like enzyme, putative cysteine protease [Chitinophaga costaii]|uniref:Transglutaminase-like enzyme, putative cysteine protease n=1 Tax=Chitinophaga costaii TaxID=1335309 RepID=A0A1C4EF31_9BACT|nr:transglutaminase family protein [Chitinophaga costaii]PUZ23866.1 transglutaminase family protein [Chitinophaga costaii]SCC42160.1 Transglutaminase-like enzyme, putative cysteine protease [Chitinophaga costaii]
MPFFKIKHITNYRYEAPVRDSANQIMLYPLKDEYQKVIRHELNISNSPEVDVFIDYYGNEVGTFTQHEPHNQLSIYSKIYVETSPKRLPLDDIFVTEQWRMLEELSQETPYIDYLKQPLFDGADLLLDAAMELNEKGDSPFKIAVKFCNYVYENFEYIKGVTNVDTTLSEILRLQAGVCQDFAHVLTTMLRFTNIPARYVSGYICPNKNGMRGEGATHAWAEAYIPGYGWLGLDPTNNCIANEKHLRLAVGRNFSDCSPVKGVYNGPSGHILEVNVSVGYDDEEAFDDPHFQPKEVAYSKPQPSVGDGKNSYQRYLDDMLIQQQQQQQQ